MTKTTSAVSKEQPGDPDMAIIVDVREISEDQIRLRLSIAACVTEARRNGYTGRDYELTAHDCDTICDEFGRKPTREEWAAEGYPHIGSAHVTAAVAPFADRPESPTRDRQLDRWRTK